MKGKHRSFFVVLILLLLVCQIRPVTVQGAIPKLSKNHYMKTYVQAKSGYIDVYTSKSLKTRGTSSPSVKYPASFDVTDEIRVYGMSGKWAYVSFPDSEGRRYGYIQKSAITAYNFVKDTAKSRAKLQSYKRPGSGKYGTIAENAEVYPIASSGKYRQVIYTSGSNLRMGWIKSSDYESYVKKGTVNVPQGWVDGVSSENPGELTVRGWAFDRDDLDAKLQIHVYVGGPAGSGALGYQITADASRPDVNDVYTGVGKYHGFDSTIKVDPSGTQTVYLYAINVGGGDTNPLIGTKSVTIAGNTQGDSESQKRAEVVSYMNKMAQVKWTPSRTITYWRGGGIQWYTGTYYYGIPYSQASRNTTLELFKSYLSGQTYVGPSDQSTYLGSDCSSAVSIAWRKANKNFQITNTTGMYPCNAQIKKVGSYTAGTSVNASYICSQNGSSVMYKAYKKLQKGDAVLKNGHIMLVTKTGTNYICVTHQTLYSSSLHSTWRVNEQWTYSKLYENGYIPVTMQNW